MKDTTEEEVRKSMLDLMNRHKDEQSNHFINSLIRFGLSIEVFLWISVGYLMNYIGIPGE